MLVLINSEATSSFPTTKWLQQATLHLCWLFWWWRPGV